MEGKQGHDGLSACSARLIVARVSHRGVDISGRVATGSPLPCRRPRSRARRLGGPRCRRWPLAVGYMGRSLAECEVTLISDRDAEKGRESGVGLASHRRFVDDGATAPVKKSLALGPGTTSPASQLCRVGAQTPKFDTSTLVAALDLGGKPARSSTFNARAARSADSDMYFSIARSWLSQPNGGGYGISRRGFEDLLSRDRLSCRMIVEPSSLVGLDGGIVSCPHGAARRTRGRT